MAVRMDKAWQPLTDERVAQLPGHLGVFQLGDPDGNIVYIGCADARTRYGLREVVGAQLAAPAAGATCFRTESTMAYRTRFAELVQVYLHDHGAPPIGNTDLDPSRFGRLRPLGG